MTKRKRLGHIALLVGTVLALFALWWWALLGMQPHVGVAASISAGSVFAVGLLLLAP